MAFLCEDLEPFLYDSVPAPDDVTGLELNQKQLEDYLRRFLAAVCTDITSGAGGATNFLQLTDTPASYSGEGGKVVKVKGTEDGLEFVTDAGGGPDSDGLVLDYSTSEQATNRTYTGGETIYQKTIVIGALPNNTTKSVAHGITGNFLVINHHFWARRASDNSGLPLPSVSNTVLGNQTQLSHDATNIILRNSVDQSAFVGDITLWYIKLA